MNLGVIRVRNWAEFQHYKNRNPAWIKLHKNTIDNYEFHCLPVASKALAPFIWLLASESDDGSITADYSKIAFRLRMSVDELKTAILPLINAGFLTYSGDASELLAECYQHAMPEKEGEREEEEESEKEGERDIYPVSDEISQAVEMYNAMARECSLPVAQHITDTRRRSLKKRLTEAGGIDGWAFALSQIRASDFLRGQNDRGWKANLDFMIQAKSFTKLMEGTYNEGKKGKWHNFVGDTDGRF